MRLKQLKMAKLNKKISYIVWAVVFFTLMGFVSQSMGIPKVKNNNSITLSDGEEKFLGEIYSSDYECIDLSSVSLPKPNLLIRALENDFYFNDLLKGSMEEFCRYQNSYIYDKFTVDIIVPDDVNTEKSNKENCGWNRYTYTEKARKLRYFNLSDEKILKFAVTIYKNPLLREWFMDYLTEVYEKISKQLPKSWKNDMILQLEDMEVFLNEFPKNKLKYDRWASDNLPGKVGANNAMLYRRLATDGLGINELRTTIVQLKNTINKSLENSKYEYNKSVTINKTFSIVDVSKYDRYNWGGFYPNVNQYREGKTLTVIASKRTDKRLELKYDLYRLKLLKDDNGDNLKFSNFDGTKILLLDKKLNILLNTYE